MDTPDGDQVLREHLARNPEAQHAVLHDPEYAAEVHRLRTILGHLDTALADEGLPVEVRQRVGARLVADCLGTDEANARVRERTEAVKKLMAQGVVRVSSL
jgi:anti-sigma-K factor RskA